MKTTNLEQGKDYNNKISATKISAIAIIGLIVTTVLILLFCSCTAQRRYSAYSSKKCHWDTGTYEAQMRKKANHE